MLTDNEKILLKMAVQQGGITQEDALDVYAHISQASDKLNEMVDQGFLYKADAPDISTKEYVYHPTKATTKLVEDIWKP